MVFPNMLEVVPNMGLRNPPVGQQRHLMGHRMISGRDKRKTHLQTDETFFPGLVMRFYMLSHFIPGVVPEPACEVAKAWEVLGSQQRHGGVRLVRRDGASLHPAAGVHPQLRQERHDGILRALAARWAAYTSVPRTCTTPRIHTHWTHAEHTPNTRRSLNNTNIFISQHTCVTARRNL